MRFVPVGIWASREGNVDTIMCHAQFSIIFISESFDFTIRKVMFPCRLNFVCNNYYCVYIGHYSKSSEDGYREQQRKSDYKLTLLKKGSG